MKKQMTKNIKKAMILFWAVICILGIKGNVYAQDIKLVAPIITSSQMENENFVIRWRTSEELKGQEYKIYCATSKDGTYEYVTTTPDYSYTEYYPNKGMAYYYKITTVYTDYETEREIESNPVYTGGIVNPLEIPTITEAKAGNNHSVTIMWNKTEDCSGYAIYRSESVDGEYKWISNVENKSEIFWWQEYESQATFTEKNLELGKTYYYKIRPYVTYSEGMFYGNFSNYKSCQVTINGTKVKSATSKKKRTNTIIWEKNSEADGYIIYYSKKIDGSYKKLKTYNSRNKLLAHSNPISRFWQKQRIKKQYAKTLKAGGKAKKTAEATAKAAKKTAQETKRATFFVVRHWKGCLLVGGIAFIVLLLFGGLSSCSLFGGNSGSGLIASSYLSEDADITGAESAYAAMEAELQDMLDNIESEYPGYDEYRVNADEIEHDPYVLISILSAWHEGVFTLDEVQSTLEMLFEKQYILTVEEEVQVRYRTETRTDSEGNPYTVEVPYNYYILHVDLENFNLSHVPVYIMGEEQLSMYAMYMSSLGNRPDLFPQSGYVSKYYENPPADYEVPAALLNSDEQFARLIEEADKYVGFPYVWGGSTPETSFDCSGFVSYVLTNSGLYNTGRLGAQGLYNISTPVSNPQPGDLVFFTGTYDTPGVSHVGIYVGEDGDGSPVMLHCGDPIQYSKLDTSYWQSHFYAYGRLNYN